MVKDKLKEVKNIEYFTKGHRGILYIGDYKKKKVVIKTERKDSEAIGRIENEVNYLKILNDKGIGPKLYFYDKKKFTYFAYEYIDGLFFPIWLEHATKKNKALIKKIIKNVFTQCFRMDKIKTNKEEMHHPYKHVIISKGKKPVLVDFERCHKTLEPKNVTQFSTYMISEFMVNLLKDKGIKVDREKIIKAAKVYKKKMCKKNLDKIVNLIK